MSNLDKVKAKLLNLSGAFTFQELEYLLGKFKYRKRKLEKHLDQGKLI